MTPSNLPLTLLSFEDIGLSPKGACQLGADALKAGRADIAERLVFSLGPLLLPHPESNPWEGPAGAFWSQAFPLDRVDWLKASIGSLPKEQAKTSSRALLMQAAHSGAFQSFEYLLSLGAARRTWKLLEAAYLAGGAGAAQKVKDPTATEAENLLRYHSYSPQRSLNDLIWVAHFLPPGPFAMSNWLERVAQDRDDLAAQCVPIAPTFHLDLSDATVQYATLARFAAQGSERSALALVSLMGPLAPLTAFPVLEINANCGPGRHMKPSLKLKNLSLIESAVIGQCPDLSSLLMDLGAQPPSGERVRSLLLSDAPSWNLDVIKRAADRANAFRETVELRHALASSTVKSAKPRGL